MNPLKPDLMTVAERLTEISAILACGLVRLHARQSRAVSVDVGDSCLDFTADRRRHATGLDRRKA